IPECKAEYRAKEVGSVQACCCPKAKPKLLPGAFVDLGAARTTHSSLYQLSMLLDPSTNQSTKKAFASFLRQVTPKNFRSAESRDPANLKNKLAIGTIAPRSFRHCLPTRAIV